MSNATNNHKIDPNECPPILLEFISYHENIRGHSPQTVDEYYLDLRNFFRYLKLLRSGQPLDTDSLQNTDPETVSIVDIDLSFVNSITLGEVYNYLMYLSRDLGLNDASRARKVSTLRSFFKYLTVKTHQMEVNPVEGLDSPKVQKGLPRYLTLDESIQLLESVSGKNQERDYCILTLFLNCGMRISELVALNVTDIRGDVIRVMGKGKKERDLFLSDACKAALQDWLIVRSGMTLIDEKALFVSSRRTRITRAGVHKMIKNRLMEAGLDSTQYSAHKLRHTAATLMLQNGVDVRALQEVLGHDHLNTTQIYTHVDNEDLRLAARANPLASLRRSKPEDVGEFPVTPAPSDGGTDTDKE